MIHKRLLSALKRHVNRISIFWNPLPFPELSVEQERCFALENLTTSFAMSPIFFNHPNTTNSIKLINFLPIVLQDKQLHLKVNADELVLSMWNIVQSTAKVLLVSFDISDNSCRLFCNVQCSVKMGFSYSLLFFSDKMLPGLLQFCEMKQQ